MALSYNFPATCLVGKDAPPCPSLSYPNSIPTSLSKSRQQPSSGPASSPSTFPLFTLLPPELRLKIWSLTLPPPRLVPLNYQSSTAPLTSRTPKSHRGCTSSAPLPITLHINHESRILALQHYSLTFGLAGGNFPSKIYFSAERGDVLFFGVKEGDGQRAMKGFINACFMVRPGSSGFGSVKRLAVQKGLFNGGAGKGVSEMQLQQLWERIMREFKGVQEVLFVERGEDALVKAKVEDQGEVEWDRGGVETDMREQMEGVCYTDDELGLSYWEEERFEEKVERVVRSVEAECGWVAPRWRVLKPRRQNLDRGRDEIVQTREKEEALVRQMRELFGHENISNAL